MLRQELMQALRLALAGQRESALAIVTQLTQTYPDEFRVWWALANMSQSPSEVRGALARVIALKPDHAEAYEMLDELGRPKPPRKPPRAFASV